MRTIIRLAAGMLLCCALSLPLASQQIDESKWGKNTKGVELATHEDPRQRSSSGTMLMYNLLGRGFPADKSYDLWFWNVGKKPQKAIQGVSFDKRGLLVCSGRPGSCAGKGLDDAINIQATALLGEPKRFAVISTDGSVAGFAEAVPFPIEAKDKSCKLNVVEQAPLAEVVAVYGSGFTPYEMLTVKAHLGGQDTSHGPTAAADGTWQAIVGTATPGHTSGVATISVSGKGCSVSVSFDWGEGSAKRQ